MEKAYNYIEKTPKNEIKIIKKEKPNVVLRNIFSIKDENSKKINNLEFEFCKKLIFKMSVFSKKGIKRFFKTAKDNQRIEEITISSIVMVLVVAFISLLIFMISSIDFSVGNEVAERTQPKNVGELAEHLSNTMNQLTKVMFPMLGLPMFIMGLFTIKKYADDPRDGSIAKGIVFIMAGSMLISAPSMLSTITQGL